MTRQVATALAFALAASGSARADELEPAPSAEAPAAVVPEPAAAVPVPAAVAAEPAAAVPEPAGRAGALPALVAAVPGLVVSGAGSWAAGDPRTGRKIAWMRGAGLGLIGVGGLPLLATGASRRVTGFTMPLVFAGGGLFLGSWLADIYAAATGGTGGAPFARGRGVEASAGLAYVDDPQFDYGAFAVVDADLHWGRRGRWRATPSAWVALDDDTQRLRAELARRFASARDGSFVEVVGAATLHRQDPGVRVWTTEASVLARLDMARLGRSLRGSFFELGAGLGLEIYEIGGATSAVDLPLARAAYGVTLGRGELRLYYDHRHDDFTGGLGTGSTFDGPWGHVGAEGFFYLTERWGLELQLTAGAAHTGRLGVLWRM